MACEKYIERKFGEKSLAVIEQANEIIVAYQAQGFTLTLRQLYYQFVSRGLIPNKQAEYDRLGGVINGARLVGLIDWLAIEDRTRNLRELAKWSDPQSILSAVASQYREDVWASQPHRLEVWIEKDALVGVIERVCNEFQVPYFACRGYSSQSEQWRAGKRFLGYKQEFGQKTIILHFGDHDPSGVDMTRDNAERLDMFSEGNVEIRRLALNMDQVRKYNPPPNPAKITDSRAQGYIAIHGRESWELDALEPIVIEALIRDEIKALLDTKAFNKAREKVSTERGRLKDLGDRWDEMFGDEQ